MEDDSKSGPPETITCPICQRPLRRTHGHLLAALECEQCGPFSDFDGSLARRRGGSDKGFGGPGSDTSR